MIKPKRTAAEQVEDEAARRALNPTGTRQTISDSQAEPEFQENHKRLRADRLAREAKLKAKLRTGMLTVHVAYCARDKIVRSFEPEMIKAAVDSLP
jgi:hypothetical protein